MGHDTRPDVELTDPIIPDVDLPLQGDEVTYLVQNGQTKRGTMAALSSDPLLFSGGVKVSAHVHYSGDLTDTAGVIRIPSTSGVLLGRTLLVDDIVLIADGHLAAGPSIYTGIYRVVTPDDSGDTVIERIPSADTTGELVSGSRVFVYEDKSLWYLDSEETPDIGVDEFTFLNITAGGGGGDSPLTKESCLVHYSGPVTDTAGVIRIEGTNGVINGVPVSEATPDRVLVPEGYVEITTVVAPPAYDGDLTLRYAFGDATAGTYYGAAHQGVNYYDLRAKRYVNDSPTDITDASSTFTLDSIFGKPASGVNLIGAPSWATYLESAGVGGVGYNQHALTKGFGINFRVDTPNGETTDIMMIAFGGSGGTFNSRKFAWLYVKNGFIFYEDVDDVPVALGAHVPGNEYRFVRTADSGGNVTNYYLNGLKVATGVYQNIWASNADLQLFGTPNTHSVEDSWTARTARAMRHGAIGQLVGFTNFLSDDEVLAEFIDQTTETAAKDYAYGGIYDVVTANDAGDTVIARSDDADETGEIVVGSRVYVQFDKSEWHSKTTPDPLGTAVVCFSQGTIDDRITDNEQAIAALSVDVAANTSKVSADGSVASHSDVDLTAPAAGQTLVYNGSLFVNGNQSIGDLSDVTITSPANGQFISRVGGEWVNVAAPSGSATKGSQTSGSNLATDIGGGISTGHGLGHKPTKVWSEFECTSADGGYAVGDFVNASEVQEFGGGAQVITTWSNTTNYGAGLTNDSDGWVLQPPGGGARFTMDRTKWRLVVRFLDIA